VSQIARHDFCRRANYAAINFLRSRTLVDACRVFREIKRKARLAVFRDDRNTVHDKRSFMSSLLFLS